MMNLFSGVKEKFLAMEDWKRWGIVALCILVAIILIIRAGKQSLTKESGKIETAPVQKGEFVISLTESGEASAKNSKTISAPKVGVNLQIVEMVSEGTFVEKGDEVVRFDQREILKSIEKKRSELAIAKADLEKAKADAESRLAQLNASLRDARAQLKLQKLNMKKLKYEADIEVQRGKLELKQAKIKVKQAKSKIESEKRVIEANRENLKMKINRAKSELEKWLNYKDALVLKAPADGLVVYQEHWRSGTGLEKYKVGDTPTPGAAIVELPDLSDMQVKVKVNELDINRIQKNDKAEIKPEAFRDKNYTGYVSNISTLAKRKDWGSSVKAFDVTVELEDKDKKVKPGMTMKVEIISEKIEDAIYVPIEAVFNKNDKKVVYVKEFGGFEKRPVTIGKRNTNYVVVKKGLEKGEAVALQDPMIKSKKSEELSKTSPDL